MAPKDFVFADPKPAPDNFDTFSPRDVFADSKVWIQAKPEKIPAPWRKPPVMAVAGGVGLIRGVPLTPTRA